MSDTESLWNFALRVYARAGVEKTCLALQDNWHADVPVLIFALWAGARGRRLSVTDIDALVASLDDWQNRVVGPVRQLRRALRDEGDVAPELIPGIKAVRKELQQVELNAERRELEYLSMMAVGTLGEPGEATMNANLIAYLDFLSVPVSLRGAHLHLVDAAIG